MKAVLMKGVLMKGVLMKGVAMDSGLRTGPVIRRDIRVYRRSWTVIAASLLEPVLYLLSIGVGIGGMIGDVSATLGGADGYAQFVGAGLLATATMNAAFTETTTIFFARLRSESVYDAMVATPLVPQDIGVGETLWAALRGLISGAGFILVLVLLGLIRSPWLLLAVPATFVVGFMFGAIGLLATTFIRDWPNFEFLHGLMLPMFLFATTFYPLSVYPEPLRALISCLPLYQSIELLRGLALGQPGPQVLVALVYSTVVGALALAFACRRLSRILIR